MATRSKQTRKSSSSTSRGSRARSPQVTKSGGPVFSAGTWAALLLLAILIGFAVYLNQTRDAAEAEAVPTTDMAYLFNNADGAVSEIEITASSGENVKLEMGADGKWALTQPISAAANQGSAQAALDQIRALQIQNELNDISLGILGLEQPDYTVAIALGGRQRTLEIGSITPTQNGYYARLDGDKLIILNKMDVDALLNLIRTPPYQETPTPSPLPPTETPVPTQETAPAPTP